jgi:hypothetical protein
LRETLRLEYNAIPLLVHKLTLFPIIRLLNEGGRVLAKREGPLRRFASPPPPIRADIQTVHQRNHPSFTLSGHFDSLDGAYQGLD